MINLREETINKIADIGLKTSHIKEYYISISHPDASNHYDPAKTVTIYGTGEENLLNDPNFNLDYDEDIKYQMIEGWISFTNGSWLQRFLCYEDDYGSIDDGDVYEYWIYNRFPELINYVKK